MSVREFVVDEEGFRLDSFLAERLARYSRSFVQGLIERGHASVDGTPARSGRRLKEGDKVRVTLPDGVWEEAGLDSWVVFEDNAMLVLEKPPGLLMHPLGESWLKSPEAALAEPHPNLAGLLQKARPRILARGVPRCGIVHRLDRETSGVLLVAKSPAAYEALIEAFKDRRVRKVYRAIVRGTLAEKATRVKAPVGRKPGHRRVLVTDFGKDAETGFRVVSTCGKASLVEARPLTGRTHQIRAHLAHLGHPVAGDVEFDHSGPPRPPRLMLHAYSIGFEHPISGKPLEFKAAPPKDFADFWAACRKKS